MKTRIKGRFFAGFMGACLFAACGTSTTLAQQVQMLSGGSLIVKFRENREPEANAMMMAMTDGTEVEHISLVPGLVIMRTPFDTESVAMILADSEDIEYIEEDSEVSIFGIPNDTYFQTQWGMHNTGQGGPGFGAGVVDADIDAPEAWDVFRGDANLRIAVIDTGVDYRHADLAPNMWINPGEVPGNRRDDDGNGYIDDVHGYDFVNNDGDPFDDHGHGTHCAGVIAARSDNGSGMSGLNWQAKIVGLKFLGAGGSGSTSGAIRALEYCHRNGIRISNNSWGSGSYNQSLRDAIAAANSGQHLFVAAAGNSGADTDSRAHYPSSFDLPNIISVGAADNRDTLASFTNFGATSVDLFAPGVAIVSTVPNNGYASWSGTSMAAPSAAGTAALVWGYAPQLSNMQVKSALMNTVRTSGSYAGKCITGGMLNAANAIRSVQPALPPLTSPDQMRLTAVGTGSISVAWNDRSTGETGFISSISTNGTTWSDAASFGANATGGSITGLAPDTLYHLRVRAVRSNPDGTTTVSSNSNVIQVRTGVLPLVAPTSLRHTAVGLNSINIAWNDLATGEMGYRVAISTDGTNWDNVLVTAANATTAPIAGLASDRLYHIRVRGYRTNADGTTTYSDYSNTIQVRTAPASLAAPTNLRGTSSTLNSLSVAWNDGSTGENGFRVSVSTNGTIWDNEAVTGPNATGVTLSGLASDRLYHIRVRGFRTNGDGTTTYSEFSNIIQMWTGAPAINTPSNLRAANIWANTIDLAWNDLSSNESGFRLAISRDGVNWDNAGSVAANSMSIRVSSLTRNTLYYFKVRAYRDNANGTTTYSDYGNTITVRTRQ